MTGLSTAVHRLQRCACVHVIDEMPPALVLARGPVERLNFQARITGGPNPIIASRRGDILILGAHARGRIRDGSRSCVPPGDVRYPYRWKYQLHEIDANPDVILAVLDEPAPGGGRP